MKKLMLAVVVACAAIGAFAGLPEGYRAVEYIQSTGTQYLKDVYTCSSATRIEMDFRVDSSSAGALYGGMRGRAWFLKQDGTTLSAWGGGETTGVAAMVGDTYHSVMENTLFAVSNCTKGTSNSVTVSGGMGGASTIGVFDVNASGFKSKFSLYGMQIYEDGNLTADLRPCYTFVNGVKTAGLYDIERDKFFSNKGTGDDFVCGDETEDAVIVKGSPAEAGEPVCGSLVGYGSLLVSDGDVITAEMPETTAETETKSWRLKGWRLEVSDASGTMTTESTPENFNICSFTHEDGKVDRITWIWECVATHLPTGYYAVEYIQSTGSQYLTGVYTCSTATRIEMDFRLDKRPGVAAVYGDSRARAWLFKLDTTFVAYGDGESTKVATTVGDTYHSVMEYSSLAVSNCTKGTFGSVTVPGGMGANNTIAIFAVKNGDYKSQYTFYGMQIYEDGNLAADLRPCYTFVNGVKTAGLYDIERDKFFSNKGTGDDFVCGDETENAITVVGDPGEVGEPVCGTLVGYGKRLLEPDEVVTGTAPTTVADEDVRGRLLGWTLEVYSGKTLVSTATSTAENADCCTYTHKRGNSERLTWHWKPQFRVTAVSKGGLTVTPESQWVDGGGSVSFTATGGEAVWSGTGVDQKTHRLPTCRVTNITGPTTVTVSVPNVAYVATDGVDAEGRGSSDAPYATIKYAIANSAAPLDVMVADGTYSMAKNEFPVISDDIRIIGESRDNTILHYAVGSSSVTFITLNHVFASVLNVTVTCKNSSWASGSYGDAFDIAAGTVSNVLITSFGTTGGTGIVNLRGDDAWFCDSELRSCKIWNNAYCMLSASAGLAERIRITKSYNGGYNDTAGCGVRLTGAKAVVRNCLVDKVNITASNARDCPAAYVSEGRLENCTVVDNYVKGSSLTGLYVASADAEVRNCIIVGNTGAGGEPIRNVLLADGASVSHCCSPDLEDGVNGNVSADPQFKTINGFAYGFRSASPCHDAGVKLPWMAGALDYLHQPRLVGTPDIGCFESQSKGFMLMVK